MSSKRTHSTQRLQRLLPRFRKLHVGVLGDLMLDRYIWGEATRLSPEVPVPVVNYQSQRDYPGGAGNVAANIAALGAKVDAFGVIGGKRSGKGRSANVVPDEDGAALHVCLREHGIGDRAVVTDTNRVTTLKTRVIARRHQIVRIDRERRGQVSTKTEEAVFRKLVAELKEFDALVLSDYDKGLLGDSLVGRVLQAASRRHIPVFVKPKTSHLLSYPKAQTVVCNAKEAALYSGQANLDEASFEATGKALLERFGCAALVVTRTEKGMTVFPEGQPPAHIAAISFELTHAHMEKLGTEIGTIGRQVSDVTGAGDTVLSLLALAMTAGATLHDAAKLANVAAGVVVGKVGTATVSPKELSAALEEFGD